MTPYSLVGGASGKKFATGIRVNIDICVEQIVKYQDLEYLNAVLNYIYCKVST